jgi:SnoaL-like domain
MKGNRKLARLASLLLILTGLSLVQARGQNDARDEDVINKVIHDSFGWGLIKDRVLFESVFAQDDDFFTYYPDSRQTVVGWDQFKKYLDKWMDPRNKVKGFEIRNLRLVIAAAGTVAWFSAVVDDEGEWDGKSWGSKDIRWTGVLEKRRGKWVIVQQHMSAATDKVLEAAKKDKC